MTSGDECKDTGLTAKHPATAVVAWTTAPPLRSSAAAIDERRMNKPFAFTQRTLNDEQPNTRRALRCRRRGPAG